MLSFFFIVLVGFGAGRLSRADHHSEEAPRFAFYRAVIEMRWDRRVPSGIGATPDERARGLQYRKSLDPMSGMLFDFGENWTGGDVDEEYRHFARYAFHRGSGRTHIVTDTKPFSLYRIPSPKPVRRLRKFLAEP